MHKVSLCGSGGRSVPLRAFRIHEESGRIVARYETLELNELSPGDVVIRVSWSGINYKDALAATGAGKILRRYPLVGGIDLAGVVEQSSDARYKAGDRVLVTGCDLSEFLFCLSGAGNPFLAHHYAGRHELRPGATLAIRWLCDGRLGAVLRSPSPQDAPPAVSPDPRAEPFRVSLTVASLRSPVQSGIPDSHGNREILSISGR